MEWNVPWVCVLALRIARSHAHGQSHRHRLSAGLTKACAKRRRRKQHQPTNQSINQSINRRVPCACACARKVPAPCLVADLLASRLLAALHAFSSRPHYYHRSTCANSDFLPLAFTQTNPDGEGAHCHHGQPGERTPPARGRSADGRVV